MRFIFYTLLFFPILVKMVFSFNEYPVGLYKHFGTQRLEMPFVYQSRAIKNGTQQPEKPVVYQSAKINHIAAIVYPAAKALIAWPHVLLASQPEEKYDTRDQAPKKCEY